MAGVTAGILLQIMLMLRLGLPEFAGGRHLGYYLAGPQPGSVHVSNRIFRDALLLVIRVKIAE
jgi:hypothetical protein